MRHYCKNRKEIRGQSLNILEWQDIIFQFNSSFIKSIVFILFYCHLMVISLIDCSINQLAHRGRSCKPLISQSFCIYTYVIGYLEELF